MLQKTWQTKSTQILTFGTPDMANTANSNCAINWHG
jgi:hypothetical protein